MTISSFISFSNIAVMLCVFSNVIQESLSFVHVCIVSAVFVNWSVEEISICAAVLSCNLLVLVFLNQLVIFSVPFVAIAVACI